MKKLKQCLAGIISSALVATSFALPASAYTSTELQIAVSANKLEIHKSDFTGGFEIKLSPATPVHFLSVLYDGTNSPAGVYDLELVVNENAETGEQSIDWFGTKYTCAADGYFSVKAANFTGGSVPEGNLSLYTVVSGTTTQKSTTKISTSSSGSSDARYYKVDVSTETGIGTDLLSLNSYNGGSSINFVIYSDYENTISKLLKETTLNTVYQYLNSVAAVTDKTVTGDGTPQTHSMSVSVDIAGEYYVAIPKSISVTGPVDIGFKIKIWGDVTDASKITVQSNTTSYSNGAISPVQLTCGDKTVNTTMALKDTYKLGSAFGETIDQAAVIDGTIKISSVANSFSAGTWTGTVLFGISYTKG